MSHFTRLLVATLLTLLSAAPAPAQYLVHSWDSFEEATIPNTLRMGYDADPSVIRVLPFSAMPRWPGLTGGVATTETRVNGLAFAPITERRHLSLMSVINLDRARLGQQGRALYRADFYLPPEGIPMPTTALLAALYQDGADTIYRFYRFGIIDNKYIFFSFTDGEGQPKIYKHQSIETFGLTRPGWHRFQIIFVGQNQIFCAVDGKFTEYSPIEDASLTRMNAGIMVTAPAEEPYGIAVADNLSIQWTNQNAPLPLSPWLNKPVGIAGQTSGAGTNPKLMAEDSVLDWSGDTRAAWAFAQRTGKPVLAMFYVPRINPTEYLINLCPNDDAARELLSRFILLRIDVNQLDGGSAAARFAVSRTPSLIVVGPDAQERGRIMVIPNRTTWAEITQMLEASSQPASGAP